MRFDAVVVGLGPGGEHAAYRLLGAGKSVALVERELIGGECSYWACIPSKTLIRPPEARSEAKRAAGIAEPSLDWPEVAAYRDFMVRNYDDTSQIKGYEEQGATVFKGAGRLAGLGVVEVGDERIEADHVLLGTGSDPVIPEIEGINEIELWTNREATALNDVPARSVIMGGGPVGLELAQMLARFGSKVSLVQRPDRLLNRETAEISKLLTGYIAEDDIDVHTGAEVIRTRRDKGTSVAVLKDGTELRGDVIIAATGRRPRVRDLGLETIGVKAEHGVPIDERCRVADGVWALGDVTGVSLFTHVAKYQGRVIAHNIMGRERVADYRAIPRVVFCDPEIATVGLTEEEARAKGLDVASASIDLAAVLARPITYEKDPRGHLGVVADRATKTLVGAWAVAPLASEWIHEAVLAIRAQIPINVLMDTVAQFPTYSEGYLLALEKLEL